jgi:glyoxylase-like metal-dependent hydrolase (beta-lactamase superfamily II)
MPSSPTWSSYRKAREVINAAATAMGGADALQRMTSVTREMSGIRTDVGQGPKPVFLEPTPDAIGPIPPKINVPRVTSVRDYANRRAYDRLRDTIYGGQPIDFATVVAPPARFTVNYDYVTNGGRTSNPANLLNSWVSAQRRFPEGILRVLLLRPDAARWIGTSTFEGRKQEVLHFGDLDGGWLSLYFDSATHLLTKTESLGDDALWGDVTQETVFLDYRPVAGLQVPYRQVERNGGFVLQDMKLGEVAVNQPIDTTLFVKPSLPELPNGAPGPKLEKLSDNAAAVWAGGGGYNSVVMAFDNYLMVLEAGGSPRGSAAALAQIKAAFPNKPVRYLLVTHWNFDHLGGIQPYVAEEATLVTTPLVKSVLQRWRAPTRTLRPEAGKWAAPRFELVTEAKRVYSDGTRKVEVYNLSPNPHVDEMLVAYLPQEKVLLEADLFDLDTPGHEGTGGRDTQYLLDWIEKTGLDVQKIVPVHGESATMADLRKSVARRKVAAR